MTTNPNRPVALGGVGERWLRCKEVAAILAISERQVWRLAQGTESGDAPLAPSRFRMPGKKRPLTRWRLSDVEQFLSQSTDDG